jgi:hypothetical protein
MTPTDPRPRSGLVPGTAIGLVAAILGAAAYGAVIGVTERELGIAAVGVGVLVGLAMTAVRPTSQVLPPLAALFSLVGAALGTFAGSVVLLVKFAQQNGAEPTYGEAVRKMAEVFPDAIREDPMTLLFWVIAAAAAFSFVSKRVKTVRESLAAPSSPQQDEAPTDYFKPHKPA